MNVAVMGARLHPARVSSNVIRPPVIRPPVFADVTWEQIADLRQNIEETLSYGASPEKLGALIEATSPTLAADIRRHSAQDVTTYVNLVLTFLQLMLAIYQIANPVTPAQVIQIINHIETTTIVNVPPPASAPLPPQP
jgi:hypothetical protein